MTLFTFLQAFFIINISMAIAYDSEKNDSEEIFRRTSIINRHEQIDREVRLDPYRPGRDVDLSSRYDVDEQPLVRSFGSDFEDAGSEAKFFLFEFVLAGDNDIGKLTACCKGHIKEGVFAALNDIVSSLENTEVVTDKVFLQLSKLDGKFICTFSGSNTRT